MAIHRPGWSPRPPGNSRLTIPGSMGLRSSPRASPKLSARDREVNSRAKIVGHHGSVESTAGAVGHRSRGHASLASGGSRHEGDTLGVTGTTELWGLAGKSTEEQIHESGWAKKRQRRSFASWRSAAPSRRWFSETRSGRRHDRQGRGKSLGGSSNGEPYGAVRAVSDDLYDREHAELSRLRNRTPFSFRHKGSQSGHLALWDPGPARAE